MFLTFLPIDSALVLLIAAIAGVRSRQSVLDNVLRVKSKERERQSQK
jgi:hypothetical protein